MNFTIERDVFLKGLGRIQGIVEKRNTIPILSNVLIEAVSSEIKLTATDLEVGMQSSYDANIIEEGKITVSAKKIYEIIKELPESQISFKAKENSWIEIRCGKALFNIVGLSPEEFPYFPSQDKYDFVEIDNFDIKQMIEKTSFSISTDETKYNLNGIFIKNIKENEINKLRFVATDGHRLSMIQKNIDTSKIEQLQKGVIFPRKGIFELKKMAEEEGSPIYLGFMENNAVIKRDRTIVLMRLVDGDFPDYNRVIPKENNIYSEIESNLLLHALRRISILSSEKSKGVKLQFKNNSLEISSSNPDFGDAREEININYDGPEISIGFNAKYLLDILNNYSEDKIKLSIKDNLSPGLLTSLKDEDFLAVVMPMRL